MATNIAGPNALDTHRDAEHCHWLCMRKAHVTSTERPLALCLAGFVVLAAMKTKDMVICSARPADPGAHVTYKSQKNMQESLSDISATMPATILHTFHYIVSLSCLWF